MPPQTQLCHGIHGHRCRVPELREAVEQSHPHLQRHNLTLKGARHDPLAQALKTMHLGLHQTAAVAAAPLLPDGAPQRVTRLERGVVSRPVGGLVAGLGALGFSHGPRLSARVADFVQQNRAIWETGSRASLGFQSPIIWAGSS